MRYELIYEPYETEDEHLDMTMAPKIIKENLTKNEVLKEIKLIALEYSEGREIDFRILEELIIHPELDILLEFGEIDKEMFDDSEYQDINWKKIKEWDTENVNTILDFLMDITIRVMPEEISLSQLIKIK